jgi:hypothetical protein
MSKPDEHPSRFVDRLLDTSIWLLLLAAIVPAGFAK